MSDPIFVMIFLPVESMYIHYYCAGINIPTICSIIYVSLAFDSGLEIDLGLGSGFIGFMALGDSHRVSKEYG